MSGRGFSRRDLLNLGGKLVMSVGAAKLVVTLPGCGGDGGDPKVDAPPMLPDAYYPPYATLDDCQGLGTYNYAQYYPGPPPYTYTTYFRNAYGCPYLYYPPAGIYCYPDTYDFATGYPYFCFSNSYTTSA